MPIGGSTNLQPFAQALGPHGSGLRLAGLFDIAELRSIACRPTCADEGIAMARPSVPQSIYARGL